MLDAGQRPTARNATEALILSRTGDEPPSNHDRAKELLDSLIPTTAMA